MDARPPVEEAAAAVAGDNDETEPLEVDVRRLCWVKDHVKQHLLEYRTAANAGQENDLDHITEERSCNSVTEDLEKDIEEIKVSFQNKTLALQRMQFMFALRNKVKENDNDSRQIMETMKQIITLSTSIIEYQQQIREKEQKLIDIRKKRLSLKEAGRSKLQEIHTIRKKQKEEQANMKVSETLKIHKELEKEREVTTVIQNVFQNIIIGSRVNWAEDPSLKATVLELEKNVDFL